MKNVKEQSRIGTDTGLKDGFYGKFGGLIIFGLPIILMLIPIIINPPSYF